MISRKTTRFILLVVLIALLLSMLLPAVSVYSELEREKMTFVFRGFNFAEVSVFGWLAVLMSVAATALIFVKMRFRLKCIIISILSALGCGCYMTGYFAVNQLIYNNDTVKIHGEYGLYVTAALYALAITLSIMSERFSDLISAEENKACYI